MGNVINIYRDGLGRDVHVMDPDAFGALRVERCGRNALILRRLREPRRRFDGKTARYELEYRSLSTDDDELVCVLGREITLWQAKEFRRDLPLFQAFRLFP